MNWPVMKTLQPLSWEVTDPDSIYRDGDLLLPYWTVRPPTELKAVVVSVGPVWQEWRPREAGGGFVGRYPNSSYRQDTENELVKRFEIYCVSERGNFMVSCMSFIMKHLQPEFAEFPVSSWTIKSTRVEHREMSFWVPIFKLHGEVPDELTEAVEKASAEFGASYGVQTDVFKMESKCR